MTIDIDKKVKCTKCGALTYWDDWLDAYPLCQKCWDGDGDVKENHRQEVLASQKAYYENHKI